jgi:GNAT superfamily N-acetyltransferase
LLRASLEIAAEEEASGLAFLGSERWVLSRLRQADFQQVNRVITLCNRGKWKIREGPSDLKVRLATRADSDDVLAVDRAAFAPMWWYSRAVFARALSLAYCFDVAYMDDACVGYQLSTFRGGRGHIVRLAVHPLWQHRGIGGRLLSEALQSLDEAGAHSITVNTQEDNRASLQLYDRFNFRRVGKPWEVWFRSLEPK